MEWIFFHGLDVMWVRVVKALYGMDVKCSSLIPLVTGKCPWNDVIHTLDQLREKGLDLQVLCPIRLENVDSISFWHDVWISDFSFSSSFPMG